MHSRNTLFKQNKLKGFTLIELIIYMAIFSIFLLVLSEIFVNILNVQLESEANSSVNQDGRYILARLVYDIKNADDINIPINIGDVTNILQITVSGLNYTYSLDSGNLELNINGASDKLNSFDTLVSDFSVQRLGNINGKNSLRLDFNLTSKTLKKGEPESKYYQTTIGIR